ncbi:hypothetical protein Smic_59040 [Streptomyces microflavus]|uniref:Uncharacterized protein n=1 Tax=Streptomyces microflavus TaxID=1919 RepID=A0A7J0CY79_STRMI|nr:hypothetical protein Smic_59040 [Streptomyces microflavus]
MVHVEPAQHQQILLAPPGRPRLLAERESHLLREPEQLRRDGLTHRAHPAVLLPGDEPEVGGLRTDMARYHLHAAVQPLLAVARLREHRGDQSVQAAQRLLHQGHTERRGVLEVPVEGGGGDPDGPGHLAQPQAAQALVLQQQERGVEEGLAGLQLLGLADSGGVTHAIQ